MRYYVVCNMSGEASSWAYIQGIDRSLVHWVNGPVALNELAEGTSVIWLRSAVKREDFATLREIMVAKRLMFINADERGSNDSEVLQSVIRKMREREAHGRVKYGTDVDRADLTIDQWLTHLQEEMMDGILYSTRAIESMRSELENLRSTVKMQREIIAEQQIQLASLR